MVLWSLARRRDSDAWRQDGLWAISVFALVVLGPAVLYLQILQSSDQLFAGPTVRTLDEHPQSMIGMVADPTAWVGVGQEGAAHTDLLGGVIVVLACAGLHSLWRSGGRARLRGVWWMMVVVVGLVLSLGPFLVIRAAFGWTGHRVVYWRIYRSGTNAFEPSLDIAGHPRVGGVGRSWWPPIGPFIRHDDCGGKWVVWRAPSAQCGVSPPAIHAYVNGPVLDLPARTLGEDARGQYLVWQRSHQQPIPYALLMQAWSPQLAAEPLVIALSALDSQDPIALRPAEARQFRQGDFAHQVGLWQGASDPTRLVGAAHRLRELGLTRSFFTFR